MFTGIIEKKSEILEITEGRFQVENHFWDDLNIWQSIAHDWACMTLESFDDKKYTFFVMQESMDKTNLWEKKSGDFFNIERCLQVWARIDGHFVSGHVDCTWKLINIKEMHDNSIILTFSYPLEFRKNIIDKWSICINWVSLTIMWNEIWEFQVSIIPHTWSSTNLWELKIWNSVNLEFDMLGKYILNNTK